MQKDLQELQVTREDEARKGKEEIKVSLILTVLDTYLLFSTLEFLIILNITYYNKQLNLELSKCHKESSQLQSRVDELEMNVTSMTSQIQIQAENHEDYVKIVHRDLEEVY